MPTPVAGLPTGQRATVSGSRITVDYLLKNPRILDMRLGEAVDQRYFVDRILPNQGTNESGVVIYEKWLPEYDVLTRKAEPLAPDDEVPLAGSVEGDMVSEVAEADGLGYVVTDQQRDKNIRAVVQRKERGLANSIADKFNARGVAVIKARAATRTFAATDWSALVINGNTPADVGDWPHSTLALVVAGQTRDRIPFRYSGMLAHPLDVWRLATMYLGMAPAQPGPFATGRLSQLAAILGLQEIIEDNTGDIERGKPILFSAGNVGGTAWANPITTEVVPERRRLRTVVQTTGEAVYYVDNDYGLLQLTGVAAADIAAGG